LLRVLLAVAQIAFVASGMDALHVDDWATPRTCRQDGKWHDK
jgi:hypothetical protein